MKTFLLIGNFGVGNFGDEALKEYFLTRFPDVSWKVVSADPKGDELARLPSGVRSFFGFRWLKTLSALRRCDGVVFGGGSLFTDVESLKACLLWWIHAAVAKVCGCPLCFAFQGVGPFRTRLGERLSRSAFRKATHISVRDSLSAKRVEAWHLSIKVIQSFDPVYSLIKEKKSDVRSQKILMVIPRKNSGATIKKAIAELLKRNTFDRVVILSLQPDDPAEAAYCLTLAWELAATIQPIRTVDQLSRAVAGCSLLLTERYHGAVAALALGVPFATVSQGEGDKLDAIAAVDATSAAERVAVGERGLRGCIGN